MGIIKSISLPWNTRRINKRFPVFTIGKNLNERTNSHERENAREELFKVVSTYIRARARIPEYVCPLLSDIQCTNTNTPEFNQFEYIDTMTR